MSASKSILTKQLPGFVILSGVILTSVLVFVIPNEVYYSGDAGIKALLAKQFASGQPHVYLVPPGGSWQLDLWRKGFAPFIAPFFYEIDGNFYINYEFWFPLITAPFFALFGFKGFLVVPLLATWGIWVVFFRFCAGKGWSPPITAAALAVLVFASPLTLYGVTYWEHSIAVFLCLAGFFRGVLNDDQDRSPIAGGTLIGLSVLLRPELIVVPIFVGIWAFWSWLRKGVHNDRAFIPFISAIKLLGAVFAVLLVTAVLYKVVYGLFYGTHAIEVVQNIGIGQRVWKSCLNLGKLCILVGLNFPLLLVFLLVFGARLLPAAETDDTEARFIFWLCIFSLFGVAALVPPGAGGKQIGSRFLLILVPLTVYVCFGYLASGRWRATARSRRRGLAMAFLGAAIWATVANSYIASERILERYRGLGEAANALSRAQADIVIVNEQSIAQHLAVTQPQAAFFMAAPISELAELWQELARLGKNKVLLVSDTELTDSELSNSGFHFESPEFARKYFFYPGRID